jgi:hypothetical protein
MARQPNHHHHHHHVSSTNTSSATPARLFDLPNGYVGFGSGAAGGGNGASSSYGSYLLPFASSSSSHVRPTTTQLLPLPLPPSAAITSLRLTGREDSTRVRLQRQRVGEQYKRSIVGNRIPGFKTSAGESFFPLLFSFQSFFSGNCNRNVDRVDWPLIDQTDVQASNAIDHCSHPPTQPRFTTQPQCTTNTTKNHNQANQTPSHQQPSSPPSEQTSASPPPHPQAQCQLHPA